MDPLVYEEHYKLERLHWWNLARKEIIFDQLSRHVPGWPRCSVIDIGAGCGSYVEDLVRQGITAEAHDGSELAVERMRSQGIPAQLKDFPKDYCEKAQYDTVLLLDVIEHLEKDADALKTAVNLLKPGGVLVVTVPACKSMWSQYDVMAHHFRRYDRSELEALSVPLPVKILKSSYFSTFLFPFMYLVRKWDDRRSKERGVEFKPHFIPDLPNKILKFVFGLEKFALKYLNFPFGSSLILILQKNP